MAGLPLEQRIDLEYLLNAQLAAIAASQIAAGQYEGPAKCLQQLEQYLQAKYGVTSDNGGGVPFEHDKTGLRSEPTAIGWIALKSSYDAIRDSNERLRVHIVQLQEVLIGAGIEPPAMPPDLVTTNPNAVLSADAIFAAHIEQAARDIPSPASPPVNSPPPPPTVEEVHQQALAAQGQLGGPKLQPDLGSEEAPASAPAPPPQTLPEWQQWMPADAWAQPDLVLPNLPHIPPEQALQELQQDSEPVFNPMEQLGQLDAMLNDALMTLPGDPSMAVSTAELMPTQLAATGWSPVETEQASNTSLAPVAPINNDDAEQVGIGTADDPAQATGIDDQQVQTQDDADLGIFFPCDGLSMDNGGFGV
ncbi:hypothetical protein KEM52_000096 [Ascosphaera acerosa]|nr:hypothetical protein KEM52_000096 [Ascosphaera acerosa]